MAVYSKFAEIYDKLIYEDIDYLSWSKFLEIKCKKYDIRNDNYLDLGCGTGNLSINLSKNFARSWCVDLSEEMLIIAERKFRDRRIKARFIRQNMIDLNLNCKFDLITCVLDCTNYLVNDGELDRFFNKIYEHLDDSGIFVFDINSKYKLENIIGDNIFTYNSDEVVYIWENQIDDNVVEMDLTFFIKDGEKYERFDEFHRERIYCDNYVEEALMRNNLQIKEKCNNYTDYDINDSCERITYIVSKK